MWRSPSRSVCWRRSVAVSIRMLRPCQERRALQRVRWLNGSAELQTGQPQPGTGTPVLVPEPRMVRVSSLDFIP